MADFPALQEDVEQVEVEIALALGRVADATEIHAGITLEQNTLLDPANKAADIAGRTNMLPEIQDSVRPSCQAAC